MGLSSSGRPSKSLASNKEGGPYLIMCCPPCTAISALQNFTKYTPGGEQHLEAKMQDASVHLECCAKLDRLQLNQGIYFFHEHPTTASSWRAPCIENLVESPFVYRVNAHMCALGLASSDEHGTAPCKMPTTFLTNSVAILQQLDRQCPGCPRHVLLIDERAEVAAAYLPPPPPPQGLCTAVGRGFKGRWR